MTDNSSNTKRIIKNSLLLYLRMFVMMIIGLYTSRVILNTLGVVDYGIQNIVGGVVAMISIVSSSLSESVRRFITFGIGKQNINELRIIFSTSINIHLFIALVIFILGETIGLWFINTQLVIPPNRIIAANWVYQTSLICFMLALYSIPYNALIIAHEKMGVFAYMTIFDAISRLLIVYALWIIPYDKLSTYSILGVFITIIGQTIYYLYCKKHFTECYYIFVLDKKILKSMFNFAGWTFLGSTAGIITNQGVNILLNISNGPIINAARGIAMNVNGKITQFVHNFMIAVNPQITKSYASGDYDYVKFLIAQSAKLSYFLILILSLPILLETKYILHLWLGTVPNHTILFVQLILINTLTDSLSNPLITSIQASGKIKKYELTTGFILLSIFPISYILLWFKLFPEITIVVTICASIICLFVRLYIANGIIHIGFKTYIKTVLFKTTIVSFGSILLPLIIKSQMNYCFERTILVTVTSITWTILIIFFIGCTSKERLFIKRKIIEKFYRKIN